MTLALRLAPRYASGTPAMWKPEYALQGPEAPNEELSLAEEAAGGIFGVRAEQAEAALDAAEGALLDAPYAPAEPDYEAEARAAFGETERVAHEAAQGGIFGQMAARLPVLEVEHGDGSIELVVPQPDGSLRREQVRGYDGLDDWLYDLAARQIEAAQPPEDAPAVVEWAGMGLFGAETDARVELPACDLDWARALGERYRAPLRRLLGQRAFEPDELSALIEAILDGEAAAARIDARLIARDPALARATTEPWPCAALGQRKSELHLPFSWGDGRQLVVGYSQAELDRLTGTEPEAAELVACATEAVTEGLVGRVAARLGQVGAEPPRSQAEREQYVRMLHYQLQYLRREMSRQDGKASGEPEARAAALAQRVEQVEAELATELSALDRTELSYSEARALVSELAATGRMTGSQPLREALRRLVDEPEAWALFEAELARGRD